MRPRSRSTAAATRPLLGWLPFSDWQDFPDLVGFGSTLEFDDILIDTQEEFIEEFNLASIASTPLLSSFTSALDDFESARGSMQLLAAEDNGGFGRTGPGSNVLALGDLLSIGGGDALQLADDGARTTVSVDPNGAAAGSSFTQMAVLSGVTGSSLGSLIADGNLDLAAT